MKFDKKYISGKFPFIVALAILAAIGILYFMLKTMTVDREKWMKERFENYNGERDSVPKPPMRGNILSANGELMASSLPNYKVHFDFMAGIPKDTSDPKLHHQRDSLIQMRDSLILANLDTISTGLADICPALDAKGYREHILKGMQKRARYFDICPGYILNYVQFQQLKQLPIFNMKNKYQSGLVDSIRHNRKRPFGSLASKVLGRLSGQTGEPIYGLERAYDSLLRGENGLVRRRRIRGRNIEIVDREPVNGYDLVSTIDVSLQDACESALRKRLIETDAEFGVVILMETATGDVKAMVNLERDSADRTSYYERSDYAMGAAMEPGSTFKTASIMVALDDGEIDINDVVDTGNGVCKMYGLYMKDSGWNTYGGYGVIDVAHAMIHSSNVGVSKLIDAHYHNQPEKFIAGLKRVGIGTPLGIPLRGVRNPLILGPKENKHWAGPSIPWMSIGYGALIPPIQTCTFYNAIANGGKMVRPRFAKGISRNGEMVEEFPVEVIKEQICKPKTLEQIQNILKQVVNDPRGTGKKARSKFFSVSGKTGTAQVVVNGSYRGGMHFVSFCGYFPSDQPKYTCIVNIQTRIGGASGGGFCGPVFSEIADRVYSKVVTVDVSTARDSTSVLVPNVKTGNVDAAKGVLDFLQVPNNSSSLKSKFATAARSDNSVVFTTLHTDSSTVPNLEGMGARDAIFAIESRGMKAKVRGRGKVHSQSIAAGTKIKPGRTIVIELN